MRVYVSARARPSVYKSKRQKQHKVLTGNKEDADKRGKMSRRGCGEIWGKSVIIVTGVYCCDYLHNFNYYTMTQFLPGLICADC